MNVPGKFCLSYLTSLLQDLTLIKIESRVAWNVFNILAIGGFPHSSVSDE